MAFVYLCLCTASVVIADVVSKDVIPVIQRPLLPKPSINMFACLASPIPIIELISKATFNHSNHLFVLPISRYYYLPQPHNFPILGPLTVP